MRQTFSVACLETRARLWGLGGGERCHHHQEDQAFANVWSGADFSSARLSGLGRAADLLTALLTSGT